MGEQGIISIIEEYIDLSPGVGLGHYLCIKMGKCDRHMAGMKDTEVLAYLFGEERIASIDINPAPMMAHRRRPM